MVGGHVGTRRQETGGCGGRGACEGSAAAAQRSAALLLLHALCCCCSVAVCVASGERARAWSERARVPSSDCLSQEAAKKTTEKHQQQPTAT